MKFSEFRNGLSDGKEYSVYLFEGEEGFFRARGLDMLKEKFLSEPELNYASFEEPSAEKIVASLSAFPFMSKKRITCVKEYYPDAGEIKILAPVLSAPPQDGTFIILNGKPCEQLKKFPSVEVINCDRATVSDIAKWIKSEAVKEKVSIDYQTAALIAEYCLSDMVRIENEVKKLLSFAGEGGVITAETVKENVARDAEYEIYKMTDFIAKKRFDDALTVITDMLDKGETPLRLIGSTHKYFRRLLHSKISDLKEEDLAKIFGVKTAAVPRIKEQAKKFSPKTLKKAVDYLSEADYLIKSGKVNEENKMWLSLFKIMTED